VTGVIQLAGRGIIKYMPHVEVKVKVMFPFLIKHRAVKACGGIEV
jgi:hypothetical protein